MGLSKDLVAASAEPLVLSILSKGENYGYAIIKEVHLLSKGQVEWTDGMLYPVLHRLEKKGVIKASWKKMESGRKRRYYRIQKSGLKKLQSLLAEWNLANEMITASQDPGHV